MDVRNRLQINSQLIHARGQCVLRARSTPESGMRRGRDERSGGPAGGTRAQQVAPSSRERHQLPGLLRLEPPGSWTALQEGGCLRKRSAPPPRTPPPGWVPGWGDLPGPFVPTSCLWPTN